MSSVTSSTHKKKKIERPSVTPRNYPTNPKFEYPTPPPLPPLRIPEPSLDSRRTGETCGGGGGESSVAPTEILRARHHSGLELDDDVESCFMAHPPDVLNFLDRSDDDEIERDLLGGEGRSSYPVLASRYERECSKATKSSQKLSTLRGSSLSRSKTGSSKSKTKKKRRDEYSELFESSSESDDKSSISSVSEDDDGDGAGVFKSKRAKTKYISSILKSSKKQIQKYGACLLTPFLLAKIIVSTF